MQSRLIHGTQPWARYEVVLDVSKESATVVFGVLLDGRGQIWISDVLMEIVDSSVVTTNWGPPRPQAVGLDFEADIFAWGLTGDSPYDYDYTINPEVAHTGNQSGYLYSRIENPMNSGAVGQMIQAARYLGQRVRLSGYLKTEAIEKSAGFWLRVDDADGRVLNFDNMQDRPVVGTTDWQLYDIVLEVPSTGAIIGLGAWLEGSGQLWVDDFQIEIVGEATTIP